MKISRREFTAMATATVAAQAFSHVGIAKAAMDSDLTSLTLSEAAARVRAGSASAVALTEATLARIARVTGSAICSRPHLASITSTTRSTGPFIRTRSDRIRSS